MKKSDEAGVQDSDKAVLNFGVRLKHARLARGMRIKDVADAADCSESLLSKLENGKIQPSLIVLHRICNALGLTLGELFSPSAPDSDIVSRKGQRAKVELALVRNGRGITLERLVPYGPGNLLQGYLHTIDVGGETDGTVKHDGEEFMYLLSGSIDLYLGDEIYRLDEGDSCFYRSEVPHGYKNSGSSVAQLIIINTPPTF
ncbi:helix-turn-helix domain-containing protein [Mesorhizobium sp. 1B3]|uniref:helix-turn-helix domain-containing protein n=1 Tax=Mesorhizobium sp. 1B3 TaxID=3243599 RepID=UPI003D982536